MSGLATLALAFGFGLGVALAASLATAAAWPALRTCLARAHPARRARAAFGLAVAPSVVPAGILALCLAPGLAGALGAGADHCTRHPDHPHLCLVHPSAALSPALAVLLGSGAVALGLAGWSALGRRTARRRLLEALDLAEVRRPSPDVRVVDSPRALCLAGGRGDSAIYVSRGLLDALTPEQGDVVIAHERAHLRRGDARARGIARALSAPHVPAVRRALLRELAVAGERACDEEAAAVAGDRLTVAGTLLAVERLAASRGAAVAFPAFGGTSVPERVRALLEPAPARPRGLRPRWLAAAGAAGLAAAVAIADPLHHAAEHLLALVLGAHP